MKLFGKGKVERFASQGPKARRDEMASLRASRKMIDEQKALIRERAGLRAARTELRRESLANSPVVRYGAGVARLLKGGAKGLSRLAARSQENVRRDFSGVGDKSLGFGSPGQGLGSFPDLMGEKPKKKSNRRSVTNRFDD